MDLLDLSKETITAIFYIWANFVSFSIALLLLIKSMSSKQTRSHVFKIILTILMVYFIGDSIWALAFFKIIPCASIVLKLARMINYTSSCFLAVAWFIYVAINVNSKIVTTKKRFLFLIPIISSIIITIVVCLLFSPADKSISGYLIVLSLVFIPFIIIILSGIIAIKRRIELTDDSQKKVYNALSAWPFVIITVSLMQVIFTELPIFCFGVIVVTLSLYIYNQESLIFTDALTGINNRNMLNKYSKDVSDKECYVLMIDVDKFKHINDTYGHLEGDKALKYIANILKSVCGIHNCFLARYGGDEFILVSHDLDENNIDNVILDIKENLKSSTDDLGYDITVSIGHFKKNIGEDFSKAIAKADEELYELKRIAHKK